MSSSYVSVQKNHTVYTKYSIFRILFLPFFDPFMEFDILHFFLFIFLSEIAQGNQGEKRQPRTNDKNKNEKE